MRVLPFAAIRIEAASLDRHIVASQHLGATTVDNLALSCPFCNRHKGPNLVGIDPASGAYDAVVQSAPRPVGPALSIQCRTNSRNLSDRSGDRPSAGDEPSRPVDGAKCASAGGPVARPACGRLRATLVWSRRKKRDKRQTQKMGRVRDVRKSNLKQLHNICALITTRRKALESSENRKNTLG